MSSYLGLPPNTDEYQERLDNAEHVAFTAPNGAKRVILYDVNGNAITLPSAATGASLSRVPGSLTSVTLLAANSSRKGLVIDNNSSEDLFVAYAASATTTTYTKRIKPYESWESLVAYTGIITGIWTGGVGFAAITELS